MFGRSSLRSKIILIISSFWIPLAVVFGCLVYFKINDIQFASMEMKGDDYQANLEETFRNLILHKIMTIQKHPAADFDKINKTLGDNLNELSDLNAKYGLDLQFTEEGLKARQRAGFDAPSLIKKVKDKIIAPAGKNTYPTQDAYDDAVNHIKTMITHVGDMSNMILDPDLNSYYLIDVTLSAMPDLQGQLNDFVTFINQVGPNKTMTLAERLKYNLFMYSIRDSDVPHVDNSTGTSINENKNIAVGSPSLGPNLTKGVSEFNDAMKVFVDKVSNIDNMTPSRLSEINQAFVTATNAVFDYQKVCFSELDTLLGLKVSHFKSQIFYSLFIGLLATLGSLCLSFVVMKKIFGHLDYIYRNIYKKSSLLKNHSHRIKTLSENVSTASLEQDGLVSRTSNALSNLTKKMVDTNHVTNDSISLVKDIVNKANTGTQTVQNMVISMNEIHASSLQLKEIEKIISEIEQKTKVINDIVSKTELLSLNASIESARAGEYGKGFAVVAEEVGNLASLSGKSSDEIRDLLKQSRAKIFEILGQTIGKIEEGQSKTNEVSVSFANIAQSIGQTIDKITQVSQATQEQENGMREVFDSIKSIEDLAHKNTTVAKDSLSTARQIEQNGAEMNVLATQTKKVLYG